jgi:hypothetical protein
MRHSDFAFANDVRAAVELRTPRTSRMLLAATLAMLAVGLIWAHFAVLEEVTRGNGRVVPSRLTQFIQSLEGGIVSGAAPRPRGSPGWKRKHRGGLRLRFRTAWLKLLLSRLLPN